MQTMLADQFPVCLLVVLIPLVLCVIVYSIIAAGKARQRRLEEFLAIAREHGLVFDPSSRRGFDDEHPHLEAFRKGHSRRAYNLLAGRCPTRSGPHAELSCIAGDYEYKITTSSGKQTRTVTYTFSFAILVVPSREPLPDILVRREHLLDRVAGFLGFDDIDFESAEFSRKFMVKSTDKRFAYDLIDAQMMEFLMAAEPPNIDLGGYEACLWFSDTRPLEPAALLALLRWGAEFYDRWPRVLRARLARTNDTRRPPA
jgi:hypothetical protein